MKKLILSTLSASLMFFVLGSTTCYALSHTKKAQRRLNPINVLQKACYLTINNPDIEAGETNKPFYAGIYDNNVCAKRCREYMNELNKSAGNETKYSNPRCRSMREES